MSDHAGAVSPRRALTVPRAPARSARTTARTALALVAWAIPLLTYVGLAGSDTTLGGPLLHLGYVALGLTAPGTAWLLVLGHRPRWWPHTLALGTVIGLAFELVGWAVFTALGIGRLLLIWPLTVLLAAVVVAVLAELRGRSVRPTRRDARPPVGLDVGVALLTTAGLVVHFQRAVLAQPLPTGGDFVVYPDLLHHLSMVVEAMRSFPLQTPQVAGVPLSYHWFTHAHLAAAAEITMTDPTLVLLRYWTGPMLILLAALTAGVAYRITGRAWAGGLAAAMVVVSARVDLWAHGLAGVSFDPLSYVSPTQTAASPVQLAVLAGIVELTMPVAAARAVGRLRPAGRSAGWLVLVTAALVGAGTKPSVLAPVIVGLAAAVVVRTVMARRVDRTGVAAWLVVVAAAAAGLLFAAGSSGGNAVRIGGFLRFAAGYADVTGDLTPGSGGTVPAGLERLDPAGSAWLAAALVATAIALLPALVCLIGSLTARRLWPATPTGAWRTVTLVLLTGTVGAGVGAFAVVDHPAYAQAYFLATVAPAAVVGAVVVLAALVDRIADHAATAPRPRWAPGAIVLGALLLGAVAATGLDATPFGAERLVTGDDYAAAVRPPVLIALGVTVGVGLLAALACRRSSVPVRVGATAAVVACLLGTTLTWPATLPTLTQPGRPVVPPRAVPAADVAAMVWLDANAAPDDLVVAGTYCVPATTLDPDEVATTCDARGFTVSGLGGRRVLLEGWAYTSESYATQREGVRYTRLPSPWPDRLTLTNQVLNSPDQRVVDELRARGVRWIYVDARVGSGPRAALDGLTVKTYDADGVAWYRIDPR